MAPAVVFSYRDKRVVAAGSGVDAVRSIKNLDAVVAEAEEQLGLPPGSYDLYDSLGKIESAQDFQRALMCAGTGELTIEVKEHMHYTKIRELEATNEELVGRVARLEDKLAATVVSNSQTDTKVEALSEALKSLIRQISEKINDEIKSEMQVLGQDSALLAKEVASIREQLSTFNVQELRSSAELMNTVREEVRHAVDRVNQTGASWFTEKAAVQSSVTKANEDCAELQRYMRGKLEMFMTADADLRRDLQLSNERIQLLQDDMQILTEQQSGLRMQITDRSEESKQLRDLLGQVREDNAHLRYESSQVRTRIHCIEGAATEKWDGFSPGVLYFRQWHRVAKGSDVQLSADLCVATGRGAMAMAGVVMNTDEGLAVGDGHCRRFGTPGQFSSYFEIEVDEMTAVLAGAGGLYVGMSLQSAEEIARRPQHDFDGWLLGGTAKAISCRAASGDAPVPDDVTPDTLAVTDLSKSQSLEALKLLRSAMPPRAKSEWKEADCNWHSEAIHTGDRIGVLLRFNRNGGARFRVMVNGITAGQHDFADAPPAEAVGFLTPVVRLAGNGKSVRLLPGLQPPSRVLAD